MRDEELQAEAMTYDREVFDKVEVNKVKKVAEVTAKRLPNSILEQAQNDSKKLLIASVERTEYKGLDLKEREEGRASLSEKVFESHHQGQLPLVDDSSIYSNGDKEHLYSKVWFGEAVTNTPNRVWKPSSAVKADKDYERVRQLQRLEERQREQKAVKALEQEQDRSKAKTNTSSVKEGVTE